MSKLRIRDLQKDRKITIYVNGKGIEAYRGESVHAALLASGHRLLRRQKNSGEARGIFCGMGICYDCLVTINGKPSQRACMELVEDGMEIDIHGA